MILARKEEKEKKRRNPKGIKTTKKPLRTNFKMIVAVNKRNKRPEKRNVRKRRKTRCLPMTMSMNHPSENRLKTTRTKKNRPERKAKKKRNKTPSTPTTPSPPPTKNYPDSKAQISWHSRDTEQKNNIF